MFQPYEFGDSSNLCVHVIIYRMCFTALNTVFLLFCASIGRVIMAHAVCAARGIDDPTGDD